MSEKSLPKRQLKRLQMKERDHEWLRIDPPASGMNPKELKKFEKKPRQLAKKSVISFGKFLGLSHERVLLEQAGMKEEAQGKKLEAEAQKTEAIHQFEHAQEILTLIEVEKGLKPPEQKSGLQLIYEKGFRVRSP